MQLFDRRLLYAMHVVAYGGLPNQLHEGCVLSGPNLLALYWQKALVVIFTMPDLNQQ